MQLKDIMTSPVYTITEDVVAEQAWHRMQANEVRHLVVVRGKDVVGLISERDLGGKGGHSMCEGKTVKDFVTRDILTAEPETSIQEVASLLRGYNIGCLPVLENDELVGIVTISDLLTLVASGVMETAS